MPSIFGGSVKSSEQATSSRIRATESFFTVWMIPLVLESETPGQEDASWTGLYLVAQSRLWVVGLADQNIDQIERVRRDQRRRKNVSPFQPRIRLIGGTDHLVVAHCRNAGVDDPAVLPA